MLDGCRSVLCDQHAESIHHILVSCSESRQLWWLILSAIWPVIVHPFGKPFLLCLGGVKAERGSARLITRVSMLSYPPHSLDNLKGKEQHGVQQCPGQKLPADSGRSYTVALDGDRCITCASRLGRNTIPSHHFAFIFLKKFTL